jgi:hypothetical protein
MTAAGENQPRRSSFAVTETLLENMSRQKLAQMAKDRGIAGWHALRKDQLIRALSPSRATPPNKLKKKPPASAATPPRTKVSGTASPSGDSTPASPSGARLAPATPAQTLDHTCQKDRIVVLSRGSYLLHAYWELSRATLSRARAALGEEWHEARPILRVLDVSSEDTMSSAERHIRDVLIHGGVNNWYIDVLEPPRSYRIDIGYVSRRGKFYVLARSNVVTTPRAGVTDALDENWVHVHPSGRTFHFAIDAEMIVYGRTEPNATVTLQGEPVLLRSDGTFTIRFSLPDSRQIIPAVAVSADGVEERTIVLAIERYTKELEPVIHAHEDEGRDTVPVSSARPAGSGRFAIPQHISTTTRSLDLVELLEERLRASHTQMAMSPTRTGPISTHQRAFHFAIDAALVVYGSTEPNATVVLQGEPVVLLSDGTFTVRFPLPDSRQIIPAVAMSADGVEERAIVLAIERSTKELEPLTREENELASEGANDLSDAELVSRAQHADPERSTQKPIQEERQRGEESHTIKELASGDTIYHLRRPCRACYRTSLPEHVEFVVEGFEPVFIGRGESAPVAEADWIEQVHSAFQHLYRKMPFEMTPSEAARWTVLEQAVDVDAYSRQTPVIFRQLGKVSKVRHAPSEVLWIDGSKEAVGRAVAPAEFAGFTLGQWFEALVERDPGTWQVRRILNVVATEPVERMSRERLKKFWAALPTTSSLPRSLRDWKEE